MEHITFHNVGRTVPTTSLGPMWGDDLPPRKKCGRDASPLSPRSLRPCLKRLIEAESLPVTFLR